MGYSGVSVQLVRFTQACDVDYVVLLPIETTDCFNQEITGLQIDEKSPCYSNKWDSTVNVRVGN